MERKGEKWNTVPYEAAFVFPQTSLSSQCYYETGNAREHAFKPYCRDSIACFFKKEVLNLRKKNMHLSLLVLFVKLKMDLKWEQK